MKTIKNFKQTVLFGAAISLSIFILFFIISCTWIGFDVKTRCFEAEKDYGHNTCTENLIDLLKDTRRSFRARNSAIWALGQLGSPTALSPLQSFYTGDIPNREPLDKTISQYELKKAIKLVSGGKNITAVFWRYGVN